LATILTAYNNYIATYANDVLDDNMYQDSGLCGVNFDIRLGFKYCN